MLTDRRVSPSHVAVGRCYKAITQRPVVPMSVRSPGDRWFIKASGPGRGLRPFGDPDAFEDDEDEDED